MTNPNSIVRFHSRNGGRASVLETNMPFQSYGMGLLSGSGVVPNSGLTVTVGGSTGNPDVLIAENASGYKFALDLVGTADLTLTKPSTNRKIVAIVAYTDDPSATSTDSDTTGNPHSCGLIAVNGPISSLLTKPTDAQIRSAITNDGGTGGQAAYAVIAYVTLTAQTTLISSGTIQPTNANWPLIALAYPVGAYFETSDAEFDPNKDWGGTWAEDTAGRVLVAKDSGTFSAVGSTGGEEKHQLTVAEMPQHVHTLARAQTGNDRLEEIAFSSGGGLVNSDRGVWPAGGNEPHNNLQPYIIIKRWHRTA